MEPSAPPKYEPVVVREQPQQLQQHRRGYDAYDAGYDQQPGGSSSGGGGATPQVSVSMSLHPAGGGGDLGPQQLRTWSTSLCGCCEDMSSCCLLAWCSPCYVCCALSPRLGESCCAPFCLSLGGHSVPMVYRTKVRAAQGIAGGAIDDCCVSSHCPLCVLCQIKRELDYVERSTGRLAFPPV